MPFSIHPITWLKNLVRGDAPNLVPRMPAFRGDNPEMVDRYSTVADLLSVPSQWSLRKLFDMYEEMDEHWLASKVLDDFAAEATQTDPGHNRKFWVVSKNPDVQKIGNAVLAKIRWDEICEEVAREMAKIGSDFEEVLFDREKGVMGLRWHNPRTILPMYDDYNRLLSWRKGDIDAFIYRKHNQREYVSDYQMNNEHRKQAPAWAMIQFKLPGRKRDNVFGDSILWPYRRIYRMLVRTEDAVVNFRWQRSPDRLVWKIDVTGIPWAEHFSYIQRWRQWLHKIIAQGQTNEAAMANPYLREGAMESQWKRWAPHQDLYIPISANKNSGVDQINAGSDPGQIYDLQYLRENAANSLGAPKYSLNLDADPDPGKLLSRKDSHAAHAVKKIQRALLVGLHRLIQIDLSWHGIDPHDPTAKFEVHGTPVTFLDEQQRAELYDLRVDLIDRMLNLGQQLRMEGVSYNTYVKFVLREFGEFDEKFIEEMTLGMAPPADLPPPAADGGPMPPPQESLSGRARRTIEEAVSRAKAELTAARENVKSGLKEEFRSYVTSEDDGVLADTSELPRARKGVSTHGKELRG